MESMNFLYYLTRWVASTGPDLTASFTIDGMIELPKTFNTALPQGSPISTIPFVIHSSVMTSLAPHPVHSARTTFVDHIGLL